MCVGRSSPYRDTSFGINRVNIVHVFGHSSSSSSSSLRFRVNTSCTFIVRYSSSSKDTPSHTEERVIKNMSLEFNQLMTGDDADTLLVSELSEFIEGKSRQKRLPKTIFQIASCLLLCFS